MDSQLCSVALYGTAIDGKPTYSASYPCPLYPNKKWSSIGKDKSSENARVQELIVSATAS